MGPTASGKSLTAIEKAKELNGEIISADSRQIYKEFNIATAKPSLEEQEGVAHHLIDVISPDEGYTVAEFADSAQRIIKEITERGKTPIVAGGTGLYFRILLEDYDLPRVAPNVELRNELETCDADKLYSMLEELDPVCAKMLHPNNKVKIIRALEVIKATGMPMSSLLRKKAESQFEVEWIGLNARDRQFLYNRIDKRTDMMIEKGLVDEAKCLYTKYGKIPSLMNTIGYQELIEHFEGKIDFDKAVSSIKQNTRRYAKRQLSWFRANEKINWHYIDG